MKERRVIILLLLTLPLPVMWWFVKDIETKYDWFVFVDMMQRPMWYVHYTAYYMVNIVTTLALLGTVKDQRAYKAVRAFFWFSVYRLVEYWLFRFSIPSFPIIGMVLIYVFYIYSKSAIK